MSEPTFESRVDAFIIRHKSALLALIHGDQGEKRLDCNCVYCWTAEEGNPDA